MTDGTSETNKAAMDPAEPSMEDILASIRQLIADDDVPSGSIVSEATSHVTELTVSAPQAAEDFIEPLVLTNPLDEIDDTDLSSFTEIAAPEVSIPEIDIEALALTPNADSADEIDLPVDSLIDDIMGVDVEAAFVQDDKPVDVGTDVDMALDDLMGDIFADADADAEGENLSTGNDAANEAVQDSPEMPDLNIEDLLPSGKDISVNDAPIIDEMTTSLESPDNALDLAGGIVPTSDENDSDMAASIDDILSNLSDDIDMSATADSIETPVASSEVEFDDNVDLAAPSLNDATDDGDELGQDFDSLMAEFMADDESENVAADAIDTAPTPVETIEKPSTTAKSDMASDDFEMGHLIDDIMDVDTFDAESAAAASAVVVDSPMTTAGADDAGVETLDDDMGIDSILSGFDDDLTDSAVIPADNTVNEPSDVQSAEGFAETETTLPETSDPDIELVKSLMAELTDTAESIDRSDTGVDATLMPEDEDVFATVQTLDGPVDDEGDDILADLLGDTLASEEELQADIQSDITHEVEAITGEAAPASSLTDLADEMTGNDREYDIATAGLAPGPLMAAVIAKKASKPSALDALMNDDEDDLGAVIDIAEPEADAAAIVTNNEHDDILSDLIDDSFTSEPEAEVTTVKADDTAALDDFDMDDLVADIVSEDVAGFTASNDDSDTDLGEALVGLIDDAPVVDTPQPEAIKINDTSVDIGLTNDLGLIEDLLAPEPNEALDATPETLNIISETSDMEIEDMAVKSARETILDEVTETAAASAFASLNQVVEEKAVVAERGDRIGDLVTAALEPMLKEWLDANLKNIVERAVQKEVKRISSGK